VAKLFITEFAASGNSKSGAQIQVGQQPAIAAQVLTFDASASVQSAQFDDRTQFVRLHTDADCHIVFGLNPTTNTNHMPLLQDSTEYFGVTPGLKLAVIQGA